MPFYLIRRLLARRQRYGKTLFFRVLITRVGPGLLVNTRIWQFRNSL